MVVGFELIEWPLIPRAKRLLLYMLVASLALFGPRYAYVAAIDVNVYFIVLYVLQVVPKVL